MIFSLSTWDKHPLKFIFILMILWCDKRHWKIICSYFSNEIFRDKKVQHKLGIPLWNNNETSNSLSPLANNSVHIFSSNVKSQYFCGFNTGTPSNPELFVINWQKSNQTCYNQNTQNRIKSLIDIKSSMYVAKKAPC